MSNEQYIYIENLANTLDIYPITLTQIFIEIEFIYVVDGRNVLINEGLDYGIECSGYTNFKSSVLKHPLVEEAVHRHFKELEEKPKREKEVKDRYVEELREEGYIVEDNDSMDITAVKDGETMKMIFQKSDEKLVSSSFSWKEARDRG